MRFRKGEHYPHPPRGPARHKYTVTEAALRQRCRNLRRTRLRSDRESLTIKLFIWQAFLGEGPRLSQRTVAHQLDVWPSYVWKVQKQATSVGWDARIIHGQRVTLDDLAKAREFTARIREEEPGLLAPVPQPSASGKPRVMTADEAIAEQWREVAEWKRKNPSYYEETKPRTMQESQKLERRHKHRGGWYGW